MNRSQLRPTMSDALARYEAAHGALPGIVGSNRRTAFIEQLVASRRRTLYFEDIRHRASGPLVADPSHDAFDPLRAAVLHKRVGNRDEAFWLVFLFIHFGKSGQSAWHLIADVYSQLDSGSRWSWDAVASNVDGFRQWLEENAKKIKDGPPSRKFGNHRKYESLDAWSDAGTGAVVASYVDWVGEGDHDARIAKATAVAATGAERFEALYASIGTVHRFGRTAAFDYCATLEKLGVVPFKPSSACLSGSTGPLKGARLLFAQRGPSLSAADLEAMLIPLRAELDVGFDVLEDALCNWQKSPAKFKPFRA
jgi:hypothetical protein